MRISCLLVVFILLFSCKNEKPAPEINQSIGNEETNVATQLIKAMVDSLGGLKNYRALKSVEYTYYYQTEDGEKKDVSIERYLYRGEKSWARYIERTHVMVPAMEGELIQGFNGKESWTTLKGKLSTNQKLIARGDFLRKTNFYWFNMMYKLNDPGIVHKLKEDRQVDGLNYKIIEVSYNPGIGDVQDNYLLYLNPNTGLVDQFLFTVMDFNRTEPLLMEVSYEEINDLQWPTYRRYTDADWDGNILDQAVWTEEVSKEVKFGLDFEDKLFDKPI